MNEYTLGVVELVHNILIDDAKKNVVTHANNLEGSWELWMQVELACALIASDNGALREQYVYRN